MMSDRTSEINKTMSSPQITLKTISKGMITAQVSEHMTLNGNINLYGKRGFMYPAPID